MEIVYLCIGMFSVYAIFSYLWSNDMHKRKNIMYGIILFSTYIMFVAGKYNENGKVDFELFFTSVKPALDLLTFKVDFNIVRSLYTSNLIFRFSFLLLIIAVWISVVHVIVTVFFSRLHNRLQIRKKLKSEHYILIGWNDLSKLFAKESHIPSIIWLLEDDEKSIKEIRNDKHNYIIFSNEKSFVENYVQPKSMIISFGDSNDYFKVINAIESYCKHEIDIYLNQSNFEYRDLYRRTINNMNKNINLFNINELTVQSFMQNHPLSMQLPDEMLDRKTGLIIGDPEIQVVYIGYGSTNQMMHYYSLMNDIFISYEGGKLIEKRVQYYVIDKEIRINHLTRNIYEYDSKIYNHPDYFDVCPSVPNAVYIERNVHSKNFLNELSDYLKPNKFTQVIVDLGNDLVSLDVSFRISQIINHNNVAVYSRIQSKELISEKLLLKDIEEHNIQIFGNLEDVVNEAVIINQSVDSLAKKQAYLYNYPSEAIDEKKMNSIWNSLSNEKRLSNRLSSTSTIFKLGLYGINFDDQKKIDEFKIIYNNEFKKFKVKDILAAQEKFRWNSYYLSLGYRPLKKIFIQYHEESEEYFRENTKKKLHACITSLEGLNNLDEYISTDYSQRKNISYEDAYRLVNFKKHDYMTMNNLINRNT